MPRFREVCLRGYRDRVEARSGLSEGANSRFTSPDRQEGSAVLRQKAPGISFHRENEQKRKRTNSP